MTCNNLSTKNRLPSQLAVCVSLALAGVSGLAWAADAPEPVGAQPEVKAAAPETMQNTRMQTLEGSKSPWSGQFQASYSGSSLNHPLAKEAPNPGNLVPAPLVTLSGTFSVRYRLDPKTTAGLGTGLTTQTPLQGQKHTTLSDPYVDIAHSFMVGPLHSRADLTLTQYTNHQSYNDLGYRQNLNLTDEIFYEFASGLTAGLSLTIEGNTFAAHGEYDKSQQTEYDFAYDPYFEYAINSTFNLRSVIGIIDYHNRDISDPRRYTHPGVYQTFGLGIAVTKAVFLYTYVQAYPYASERMTTKNTTFGCSTIVNLF